MAVAGGSAETKHRSVLWCMRLMPPGASYVRLA
jgi:hypothetical protein